ncbi:hypothetical protein B0T26DRAFT_681356 [Lasiosphaeria miniovina]|uniref:Uncharacterized protein n=1 Tax=Lasiosphaeria miniovina TaxID=1954250 RepID=A0AA40DHG7_9PEZI|nr:uncharacterized protein B0T26DRAFT_681356 [Lasiosphaeria miniovina]KAK0703714.1 hypothetical protein B0T26DRAFT_681356 [Lasiosphaeria miniovina]
MARRLGRPGPEEAAQTPYYDGYMQGSTEGRILLLDSDAIGARYRQLVSRPNGHEHVRSKGGTRLPGELWNTILEFAAQDPPMPAARQEIIAESLKTNALSLCCTRHKFDYASLPASSLPDMNAVLAFERYLGSTQPHILEGLSISAIREQPAGPGNTFDILLEFGAQDAKLPFPCLFTDFNVLDVILWIYDGLCWMC